MSLPARLTKFLNNRFPRVSGDEPKERAYSTLFVRFSPRERG